MGKFRRQPITPPVKVGDELDVKIEAVGEKGDGIAKKEGFVLFVPNTKEGDLVRVKVTRVLRNVGFAEVIGEAQGEPESEETPAEGEAVEEPPSKEQPEDTEDFGEELEQPEETPAEEKTQAEETPAEEKKEE
ncbi:hypothetical protein DRJ17_04460 [Candidatus Woesearchaeota archaeon]|nr:MAG: hypothetical protein DRJ17_04460 [Candidatus Woesearchaeota archaeon]